MKLEISCVVKWYQRIGLRTWKLTWECCDPK